MSSRTHRGDDPIKVRVHFYGDVRRYLPPGAEALDRELPPGSTVGDLLDVLGVVPADDGLVVGVNGILARRESVLTDGDEVSLVTPMMGGAIIDISKT